MTSRAPLLSLALLLAAGAGAQQQSPRLDIPPPRGPLLESPAAALNDILPADQAFVLAARLEGERALVLEWDIREGYYLYRHSLAFTGAEAVLGEPHLPVATEQHDEFFGDVAVYYDHLRVSLPILDSRAREVALTVRYQGCAEARYCYPPQEKTISLTLP